MPIKLLDSSALTGFRFLYDSENKIYIVRDNDGGEFMTDDPLAASANFYARCELACQRRISEMYRKEGKNSWTGMPLSANAINTDTGSI